MYDITREEIDFMPDSVANAAPATVMPLSLSRAFEHSRAYTIEGNDYPDGRNQRRVRTASSRRSWALSKRMTPTLLVELRDFFDARKGGTEPFYFYDPFDGTHDPTGVSGTGRFTVRFDGDWQGQLAGPGQRGCEVDVRLVEVA